MGCLPQPLHGRGGPGLGLDGKRIRRKVSGKTKVEVRDKLKELHQQLEIGLKPRRSYTVADALEDWLAHGVDGLAPRTITLYRGTIAKTLNEQLGRVRLSALTAADVHRALAAMAADRSTRTVQIAHNVLVRAIRQAERDNLVGRNVAALAEAPRGQKAGRPPKSLTLDEAVSLLAAAKRKWAAPRFPDRYFAVNSRCYLLIQELIHDLLRGPVPES